MHKNEGHTCAGGQNPRRLFVYSGGFLWQHRVRRILHLDGWRLRLGRPDAGDHVGVWGQSPTAHRGESMATRHKASLVRIEDAFLRSLFPGRTGEPPMGLLIDRTGLHFDAGQPSDLETLLATNPLDDTALLNRARGVIARLRDGHLSKYSATDCDSDPPEPGYVLVIDQTRGDASVRASGGDRARFLEMLTDARQAHPGTRILIKTHPETTAGHRPGHFSAQDTAPGIEIFDRPLSPWLLLDGAVAVYTLSSQMGFEAILAGHRPRVFGTPFYAGWGLTQDETVLPRRGRMLTRAQLTAAAMVLYPKWYDPYCDRLCPVEDVLNAMEAQSRAWRQDRDGWVGQGMRLWKRGTLQRTFGQHRRMRFAEAPASVSLAQTTGRRRMVWASKAAPDDAAWRLEDGFLRSRGLGASLVPPVSLVLDPEGIYYDPTRKSQLETLIRHHAGQMRPDQIERIERAIAEIHSQNLSKYNLSGNLSPLPEGHRILVPGQVSDDASIRQGAPRDIGNAELLAKARADNPDAVILYKPHPDVVAGLREGHVDAPERWADAVLPDAPIAPLLAAVQEVWTLTSLTGFEALLRGCRVTVLGTPFYAGWGLTRDLGPVPARRLAGPRPGLQALAYATLIAYPRYHDPVTGLPCPLEVALTRLGDSTMRTAGPANRLLSKLQGALASHTGLWR